MAHRVGSEAMRTAGWKGTGLRQTDKDLNAESPAFAHGNFSFICVDEGIVSTPRAQQSEMKCLYTT